MTPPLGDSSSPEEHPGGPESTSREVVVDLEFLYLTQAHAVYTSIRSRTGLDQATAEDITHHAFMKVGERMRSGAEVEDWVPYLFAVARNMANSWFRAQRRAKTASISEPDLDFVDPDSEAPYDGVLYRRDRRGDLDAVMSALAKLPPRQREIVVMREMCNLPTAQIAQILGLNEGTVRYHLSVGFRRLKGFLLPCTEETEDGNEQ